MASTHDLVHCPICLEVYDLPRALPCLHTFCETCIQEYINAAVRTTPTPTGFDCPVCRRRTDPPGSAKYSEWSKLFPLNHIIVSLIDSRDDFSPGKQSSQRGDSGIKAGSSEAQSQVTSSSQDSPANTELSRSTVETAETLQYNFEPDFQKGEEKTTDSYTYGEYMTPPPYHPPPPHGQPPHWGPPPPHHFHPPHGHPPHHGPPGFGPPPHMPPPPHHRPHHRGRGCHRPPHGGPGGRFHHPHGPRHRHHHPGPRRGCPP